MIVIQVLTLALYSVQVTLPDGRMQHIVYTSHTSSMEYRDNYSQVDQAMEGDNTHGSYKVSQHL